MKFVADVMLGRLTRLMRFAGYDVEYDASADDGALRQKSRFRILLTKDRSLANSVRPSRVYFVNSIGGENQLTEIRERFPLKRASARCLICNRKIRKVSKRRIQHLVPPFVFNQHSEFYRCPQCARVYWKGTHFERMSRIVE